MMAAADRDAMIAKIMSMKNVPPEEAVEALRECNWASAAEALALLEQKKDAAKIAPTSASEKNLKGKGYNKKSMLSTDTKSRDTGGKKPPRPRPHGTSCCLEQLDYCFLA